MIVEDNHNQKGLNMFDAFPPIIYPETDGTNLDRCVWVRVVAQAQGFTIATFATKPTLETPVSEAMTVVSMDPCWANQTKIVAYDQYTDPENEPGRAIILVRSVDDFTPRPLS